MPKGSKKKSAAAAEGKPLQGTKKLRLKANSKAKRAGLTFPVGRVERFIRERRVAPRVSGEASVMATAALEYVMTEIIEDAVKKCDEAKVVRLTTAYLNQSMSSDQVQRLLLLTQDATGPGIVHPINIFPDPEAGEKKQKKKKSKTQKQRKGESAEGAGSGSGSSE